MGTLEELINTKQIKAKITPKNGSFSGMNDLTPSTNVNDLVLQKVEMKKEYLRLAGSGKVSIHLEGTRELLEMLKGKLEDYIGQTWDSIKLIEVNSG